MKVYRKLPGLTPEARARLIAEVVKDIRQIVSSFPPDVKPVAHLDSDEWLALGLPMFPQPGPKVEFDKLVRALVKRGVLTKDETDALGDVDDLITVLRDKKILTEAEVQNLRT